MRSCSRLLYSLTCAGAGMLWHLSEHVVLLDHAATVDNDYIIWQGNWAVESTCKPAALAQRSDGEEEPTAVADPKKTCPATAHDLTGSATPADGHAVGCGSLRADVHDSGAEASLSLPHPNQSHAQTEQLKCNVPSDLSALIQPNSMDTQQQQQVKRKRKRKRQGSSDQQALDARHPGNERNRVAQGVVSAALEVFLAWRQPQCNCASCMRAPIRQAAVDEQHHLLSITSQLPTDTSQPLSPPRYSQAAIDQSSPSTSQLQAAASCPPADTSQPQQPMHSTTPCGAWHSALQRKRQILHAHTDPSELELSCGEDMQSSGNGLVVDWVSLAAMRHVLRPKLRLLRATPPPHSLPCSAQSTPACGSMQAHGRPCTCSAIAANAASGNVLGSAQGSRVAATNALDSTTREKSAAALVAMAQPAAQSDLQGMAAQALEAVAMGSPLPAAFGAARNLFGSVIANDHAREVVARAHDTHVLLPAHSSFLMTDLSALGALTPLMSDGRRFKAVVCDPPWENASVKRSGRYQTLPSRSLLHLPMQRLLDPDTGVLFLWMTNREKLHRFVMQELLPAWGMRHVATWYWLKLAPGGQGPASSLATMHRHPFEHIIVAAPTNAAVQCQPPPNPHPHRVLVANAAEPSLANPTACAHAEVEDTSLDTVKDTKCATDADDATTDIRGRIQAKENSGHACGGMQVNDATCTSAASAEPSGNVAEPVFLPSQLVLLSVPAAEHSRKPHLGPLLHRFLPRLFEAKSQSSGGAREGLELFARELHTRWTSVGDEALHFQQLGMFRPVK